jgi:hypothetical protein
MEWIRQKRDEAERAGQLRGFLQEYMLMAIGTQDLQSRGRMVL